ncbi:MAG TPA: sigma-70 family RNA polymerase sigma factor [Streptosporangiaceae bacterium]
MDEKQAAAFGAFVNESGGALLRTAVYLTSDLHVAEDVYQETIYQLSKRWPKVYSPLAFCRRVMHNLVIDRARAQRRRPRELELNERFDNRDPRCGDGAAAVELRPALFSALATLTAQQRAVVVLRYGDDRSANEVAVLRGVSTGTVKSTASRAMARLRTHPALIGLFATTETSPIPEAFSVNRTENAAPIADS